MIRVPAIDVWGFPRNANLKMGILMIGNRTIAVPGPANIPNRIAQAMQIPLEDHRAPDLGDFTKPLLDDLKKVFLMKYGRVVVFGQGTGGWEAGLRNCLKQVIKFLLLSLDNSVSCGFRCVLILA